jgi:hypothetical protein
MNNTNQRFWTYELTAGTLTINSNFGLNAVSILLKSGTGTVTGSLILQNGTASAPINLETGNPLTLGGLNGVPLDGIEITTTGVISIIGRQ